MEENKTNVRELFKKWKPVLGTVIDVRSALIPLMLAANLYVGEPVNAQQLNANQNVQSEMLASNAVKIDDGTEQAPPESNALKDALEKFYEDVVSKSGNDGVSLGKPRFNENDAAMSEAFEKVFSEAFLQDSVAQKIPMIDKQGLEKMSAEIDFMFSTAGGKSFGNEGRYVWEQNYIYTASGAERFPNIVTHEIGHYFGLGEPLACLFSEELMGVKKAENESNWEYCTVFDRALMEKAGEDEFWKAAFTSEQAYEELWNKHMFVNYLDMQLARKGNNNEAVLKLANSGMSNEEAEKAYQDLLLKREEDLQYFKDAVNTDDEEAAKKFVQIVEEANPLKEYKDRESYERNARRWSIKSVEDKSPYRKAINATIKSIQKTEENTGKENVGSEDVSEKPETNRTVAFKDKFMAALEKGYEKVLEKLNLSKKQVNSRALDAEQV